MPLKPLLLAIILAISASAEPLIRPNGVQNAASNTSASWTGQGLAPGSIFVVKGARLGPAELLLVHDGVVPNTWLAMSAGCEHYWHTRQQCWHPRVQSDGVSSVARVSIVGDAGGIVGGELAGVSENQSASTAAA